MFYLDFAYVFLLVMREGFDHDRNMDWSLPFLPKWRSKPKISPAHHAVA